MLRLVLDFMREHQAVAVVTAAVFATGNLAIQPSSIRPFARGTGQLASRIITGRALAWLDELDDRTLEDIGLYRDELGGLRRVLQTQTDCRPDNTSAPLPAPPAHWSV
ncbi:MAG: hypothetical protein ACKVP5_10685 [Aestuariivirga sp.]